MKTLIFLIDDDEDEKEIFVRALDEAGVACEFVYFNCVQKALNMLKWVSPDYIFIDMNMPVMNGLEGIARIRRMERMSNVNMVMYSNGITEKLTQEAKKQGALTCMKKPSTINELTGFFNRFFNAA
jgi:DNA-binding NtrC family response regulator